MRRFHDRSTSAKLLGRFVSAGRSPVCIKHRLRGLAPYALTLPTAEVDGFPFVDVFRKTPLVWRRRVISCTRQDLYGHTAERLQRLARPGVLTDNNSFAPMQNLAVMSFDHATACSLCW
jgi:hypothetical protein